MKPLLSVIFAFIIAIGITACGYDGHYRYPCQDPANFGSKECIPPLCKVNGQCTEDLLGFDPTAENVLPEESTDETTSDIIEESSDASASEPEPENVDDINNMVDNISRGN